MRDLLLLIIVMLLCGAAVMKPFWGLLGYVWYALMRPDVLAWAGNEHPYSMALAVCTLIGSLRESRHIFNWLRNPFSILLILSQIPNLLSIAMAQDPSLCYDKYYFFLRVLMMALLILVLTTTEQNLRQLYLVVGVSMAALGAKFGLWGLLRGGVSFTGGYGGFVDDNNTLALALVTVMPFLWFGRNLVQAQWARLGLTALFFLNSATVVMSHSRGGALAMGAMLLTMLLHSRRKIVGFALIVLMIGPTVYLVRESYMQRLATFEDLEDEGSARARMEYARVAIAMWRDYPFFGVGFGSRNFVAMQSVYSGRPDVHVVHNNYLQILVDSGIFALLFYLGILFGAIVWLGRPLKKFPYGSPGWTYSVTFRASLVGYAVGSTFLSRVTFDLAYDIFMMVGCWYILSRQSTSSATPARPIGQVTIQIQSPALRRRPLVAAGVNPVQ